MGPSGAQLSVMMIISPKQKLLLYVDNEINQCIITRKHSLSGEDLQK